MKESKAVLLLLVTSMIWGLAFVAQSDAAGNVDTFFFNGTRMVLGFIVLLPLVIPILKRHKGEKKYFKALILDGLICGILTGAACIVQQYGVEFTTAGKAGFITSLYTLIVPVFSMFLGKKVPVRIWICIAVGLVGTFLLSFDEQSGIGAGDLIVLISSFLFAIQIMVIDHVVNKFDGVELSAFQFLFGGVLGLIVGYFVEGYTVSSVQYMFKSAWLPILYAGVCSCGIAYTLQIIGQKWVAPFKATLALSLESAWAAFGGLVMLNERMDAVEVIGCVLMFAAVIVAQLPAKGFAKGSGKGPVKKHKR